MKPVSRLVFLWMGLSLVFCTGAQKLGIGQAINNGTDATSLTQIADMNQPLKHQNSMSTTTPEATTFGLLVTTVRPNLGAQPEPPDVFGFRDLLPPAKGKPGISPSKLKNDTLGQQRLENQAKRGDVIQWYPRNA